jgi:hypothetical protein
MSLSIDTHLGAAGAAHRTLASVFGSVVHNALSLKVLTALLESRALVFKKIFENIRQLREEHVKASIEQHRVRLYKAEAYKKIFESSRL